MISYMMAMNGLNKTFKIQTCVFLTDENFLGETSPHDV